MAKKKKPEEEKKVKKEKKTEEGKCGQAFDVSKRTRHGTVKVTLGDKYIYCHFTCVKQAKAKLQNDG